MAVRRAGAWTPSESCTHSWQQTRPACDSRSPLTPISLRSQAQLLRRVAPSVGSEDLVTLLSLFGQLRLLHSQGNLSYPYSVRELALVARHLDAFPTDGLHGALLDVFDFDSEV